MNVYRIWGLVLSKNYIGRGNVWNTPGMSLGLFETMSMHLMTSCVICRGGGDHFGDAMPYVVSVGIGCGSIVRPSATEGIHHAF